MLSSPENKYESKWKLVNSLSKSADITGVKLLTLVTNLTVFCCIAKEHLNSESFNFVSM